MLIIACTVWLQLHQHASDSGEMPQPLTAKRAPSQQGLTSKEHPTSLRTTGSAFKLPAKRSDQYFVEALIPTTLTPASTQRLSYSNYKNTQFKQTQGHYPFYVAQKTWDARAREYQFYRVGMQGSERVIKNDVRRYFISENQSDYPEPEGGCGPTALLNLYIWYSKFGLIHESVKHSNPRVYKQLKFREIDKIINQIQGRRRSRSDGTNIIEQVLTIDELVQKGSRGKLRIHFEYKQPPLTREDFLNLSRNYRAGILAVRPKDPKTGRLMGNHAVLVIRGDTSGKITIANWGKFSHGRLVERKGSQWFVPDDSTQHEMQIVKLTTLVPFTPRK